MQNADWIALLRQIPTEIHPQVVLVLNNRTELSIETVLRTEPTFLLMRGRVAGTTEGGLAFIVPYEQVSAMYLHRQIKETEVEAIFGPARGVAAARPADGSSPPPTVSLTPLPEPMSPAPEPSTPGAAMPAFGRPSEATAVARNNLLERLRAARQAAQPTTIPTK